MSGVCIEGLSKTFVLRDAQRFVALENVSFSTREGEFCCLVGPSGCGKSTILNLIAGLVEPDEGSIRFTTGERHHARIGYVFQKGRLLPWKTVRGNIAFALRGAAVARDLWDERIRHYVGLVGLERFIDEYPVALSGGMQQRVAIARALAIEPDLLLMDEPFGSLDELTARAARQHLLSIWAETRKSILFVTHNALEAAYLADRVFLFRAHPGRLVCTVTIDIPREQRSLEEPRLITFQKQILAGLGVD